ncbi:hypothetical protein [Streptomyces turgidiscabies]|uniref:hypothetical protein n=1 Tax=Streptomyces turgidiscabies TaxID=85558 RepID=UPI0038F740BB
MHNASTITRHGDTILQVFAAVPGGGVAAAQGPPVLARLLGVEAVDEALTVDDSLDVMSFYVATGDS